MSSAFSQDLRSAASPLYPKELISHLCFALVRKPTAKLLLEPNSNAMTCSRLLGVHLFLLKSTFVLENTEGPCPFP